MRASCAAKTPTNLILHCMYMPKQSYAFEVVFLPAWYIHTTGIGFTAWFQSMNVQFSNQSEPLRCWFRSIRTVIIYLSVAGVVGCVEMVGFRCAAKRCVEKGLHHTIVCVSEGAGIRLGVFGIAGIEGSAASCRCHRLRMEDVL